MLGAVTAFAVLAADLVAARPTDDYSSLDRAEFLRACSEGREFVAHQCGCVYDYIRARVSYRDYEDANRTENAAEWPPNLRAAMASALRRRRASAATRHPPHVTSRRLHRSGPPRSFDQAQSARSSTRGEISASLARRVQVSRYCSQNATEYVVGLAIPSV